jgi:hypothetical protein
VLLESMGRVLMAGAHWRVAHLTAGARVDARRMRHRRDVSTGQMRTSTSARAALIQAAL